MCTVVPGRGEVSVPIMFSLRYSEVVQSRDGQCIDIIMYRDIEGP